MSMRTIPEGATITSAYLQVPGLYGNAEFKAPNTSQGWDDAVRFAREKKATLIAKLTESLGVFATPESIEENASNQVRIDLRWLLSYNGGSTDTVIESFKDIGRLRTSDEIGGPMPGPAYV